MMVIDLTVLTEDGNRRSPEVIQSVTRHIMVWLREQGIEGNLNTDDNGVRIMILTDGWKKDQFQAFGLKLAQTIEEKIKACG